ncbi:MAG: TdeIII family type II restriction endonuclease [Candidatus Cloacimonadales bacterium]|nr:TdeIII family type II restriction endonuclease [Candidatus Cloacimonadales bacterium]
MTKLDITKSIEHVITSMMDNVMKKVLIDDPFIVEEHHAKKPLYAALVPDEIFKGSHFERRFVTPFGKVWEKLAKVVGEIEFDEAILGQSITGNIGQERLQRINEVLRKLEHPDRNEKRTKPNWDKELKYILEGKGKLIPVTVLCDLYVQEKKTGKCYSFEIKAPLPNSDQTKVSKEKILKLYSMTPAKINGAFFALPYNPYKIKANYSWQFPMRWFNMREDKVVLIGDEFWDFIGGIGTYKNFINVINKLGLEYRTRIYKEFLGIDPPEDYEKIKL